MLIKAQLIIGDKTFEKETDISPDDDHSIYVFAGEFEATLFQELRQLKQGGEDIG